jgi:hypothetical protein
MNGPGVAAYRALGDQRQIEQLALQSTLRRRHRDAGPAELGELAPQHLFLAAIPFHDAPHPGRRAALGQEALDRVLQQQLVF